MHKLRLFLLVGLFTTVSNLCLSQELPAAGSLESLRLSYYAYDPDLALNAEVMELPDKQVGKLTELRTRYTVKFDSVHDQRVTAILTIPKKVAAPHPAILLLAGSGGHKDTDYVRISADMLNTQGFATISLDAQYHGERARPNRSGDVHLISSNTMRDGWVQTVIDLRRAVDFLASRKDIDMSKLGYLGFSQGGMIGGTFLGVEPRVQCAVLAIPGAGLAEWSKKLGLLNDKTAPTIAANAQIVDPIHFLGRFEKRPLLVLSAKKDELIPREATEALFAAAREPKEIKWYDSGHVLPPTAFIEARSFFAKRLGARTSAP